MHVVVASLGRRQKEHCSSERDRGQNAARARLPWAFSAAPSLQGASRPRSHGTCSSVPAVRVLQGGSLKTALKALSRRRGHIGRAASAEVEAEYKPLSECEEILQFCRESFCER